jgi:integrase
MEGEIMSQRRPGGAGSVYQRSDGRWIAAVKIEGRKVIRYAKTEKEARAALKSLLVDQHAGQLSRPVKVTLSSWVEEWLTGKSTRLLPSTISTYRLVLGIITDRLGDVELSELTPLTLTRTFRELEREGRGRRQLHLGHGYLKACLAQAVNLDIIRSNPMERVEKPVWQPRHRTYWTVDEAARFITTAITTPHHYCPLFAFLTVTGLRLSEALGIMWEDVDLEHRSIRIERTLILCDGKYIEMMEPKTRAGRRTVSLPLLAVEALNRVQRTPSQSGAVFITTTGKTPFPSDLRKRLREICNRADVPVINIHGLRHVAAMLALEATGDPYLVQQRLGHSHISVTLGIYGYSPRNETVVASRVDDLLGWKSPDGSSAASGK